MILDWKPLLIELSWCCLGFKRSFDLPCYENFKFVVMVTGAIFSFAMDVEQAGVLNMEAVKETKRQRCTGFWYCNHISYRCMHVSSFYDNSVLLI